MSVAEKLTEIAENVPKVFEAGVAQGYETGYQEGAQNAPMTDKADFWAKYQLKGRRENYDCAFGHPSYYDLDWNIKDFKPEYSMEPTSAYCMFRGINGEYRSVDLVELLDEQGVYLNFAGCKNLASAFAATNVITHIGLVDCRSATDINRLFFGCTGLDTIDKLIVKKSHTFTGVFSGCVSLKNITIEGEIGHRIQFHRSMSSLSGESILSIINALSDSVTKEEIDGVVSKPSVYFASKNIENVFGSVDSPTWLALVDSKPNWNFVLA